MANKTITSANSVFAISIPGLVFSPVIIQNFATDSAFTTDSQQVAETQMGVDGHLSGGWVAKEVKQKIKLAADSISKPFFDRWNAAQQSQREVFFANATIDLPSLGESYNLTRGVLTNYKNMPDVKKVLESVEFDITWESITRATV